MKKKISRSDLIWKDGGFTRLHYWIVEFVFGIFILSGISILAYAFFSRNFASYESLHILVLVAVGFILTGIAIALLSMFELLFFIGADRLGILSKENEEEKEES